MTERTTVVLTGTPVLPLPRHLVVREMIDQADEVGDCGACSGTGIAIIYLCLAGDACMHVKDCPHCAGTGWGDRVERGLHTPSVRHHTVPIY